MRIIPFVPRHQSVATALAATFLAGAFAARPAVAQMTRIAVVQPTPWVIRGLVRDQVSQRPLQGGAVVVFNLGGAMRCTTTADFGGHFRCALPTPGTYQLDVRHIGYAPVTTDVIISATGAGTTNAAAGTPVVGDTIDVAIDLENSPAALDTVRITDTVRLNGLLVTHGRVQFEKHMMLGKGHFLSGFEMTRSANTLSEYIGRMDSMKLVTAVPKTTPVVPAAGGKFLTSTIGSQCLYARVDHQNLATLMRQRSVDNIDGLVRLTDVVGVEIYLSFQDVPSDWKMDAWPTSLLRMTRQDHTQYTMGNIGMLQAQQQPRRTPPPRPGRSTDPMPNMIPTCPFVQVWTKVAW